MEDRSQASRMASTILGWLCPIVEQIWPLVKSRYLFPSWSQIHDPSARLPRTGRTPRRIGSGAFGPARAAPPDPSDQCSILGPTQAMDSEPPLRPSPIVDALRCRKRKRVAGWMPNVTDFSQAAQATRTNVGIPSSPHRSLSLDPPAACRTLAHRTNSQLPALP
jgi:hypothetical protein